MKKIVLLMITLVALVAVAGCGKDNKKNLNNTEITNTLTGVVLDIADASVYMSVLDSESVQDSGAEISFGTTEELLETNGFMPQVGDTISITITDQIGEFYPAQVQAISWSPVMPGEAYIGTEDVSDATPAPSIVMYVGSYFESNMPVDELPQDYTSAGTLTAEEANNTGLEGCQYFLNIKYDSVPDMYVYQECGTPISENEIDNTKRQWAYVQWVKR